MNAIWLWIVLVCYEWVSHTISLQTHGCGSSNSVTVLGPCMATRHTRPHGWLCLGSKNHPLFGSALYVPTMYGQWQLPQRFQIKVAQGVGMSSWKWGPIIRSVETSPLYLYWLVPECLARVPVSLWGCGGWAVFARHCATVRNRSQPFATVRNCLQPSATVCNRPQPFATVRARSLWPCVW